MKIPDPENVSLAFTLALFVRSSTASIPDSRGSQRFPAISSWVAYKSAVTSQDRSTAAAATPHLLAFRRARDRLDRGRSRLATKHGAVDLSMRLRPSSPCQGLLLCYTEACAWRVSTDLPSLLQEAISEHGELIRGGCSE